MGGCYTSHCERPSEPRWKTGANEAVREFFKSGEVKHIAGAFRTYSETNDSGFIKFLLDHRKLVEAKKEFLEFEYEVKFNITNVPVRKNAAKTEPTLEEYLDAFEFPVARFARYIKDACNNTAEGTNYFLGEGADEKLVVIQKMGKLYLKEKGQPVALNTGVPFEEIVMKRNERRWETTLDELLRKAAETHSAGSAYKGRIRKEKGDAFILDTFDGRIYSLTVNRSHLLKPGQDKESEVQRQLEMEYAGFVPGFPGLMENSEEQIVLGMVDLAKYVGVLYGNAPVNKDWRIQLSLTNERKYDFVSKDLVPGSKVPALQK